VRELSRAKRGLDEHLSSLKERWAHAAEAGAAADAAVRGIVAQIGKIVVATQYQDITRQQIEHISDALDEIRREFDDAGNAQPTCETELAGFVGHAGLVQCRQMDVVADEVDKASKTIVEGMRRILDGAGSLARCQRMAESSGDDLVEAFRNDIRSVTGLDEAGSAISDELATWTGPNVQMLSEFAAESRRYSADIRLAAINAQVHACRAHRGEVLEVLASRLRSAADASLGIIDQMSRVRVDIIRDLSGDLDQLRHAAIAEGNELRQEIGRVTAMLEQVQTDVRRKAAELTSLHKKLTEDTQMTISQTDLQGTVVSPVLRAKSAIEALVGSLELDEQARSDSTVRGRIAALRQSYTVERERNVHDVVAKALQEGSAVGSVPGPAQACGRDKASVPADPTAMISAVARTARATAVADASVTSGAGSLGDNVELF